MPTDNNPEVRNLVTYMQVLLLAQRLHDRKYPTAMSRIRHRRSYKRAEKGLRKHREYFHSELNRLKDEHQSA